MKIKTQYVGPTNTRGARIKASCALGTKTIPYLYEVTHEQRHRAAFLALVDKLALKHGVGLSGWTHEIV